MQIGKSSSLPHISHNYNKYDNFFSNHPKQTELAMESPHEEIPDPETTLLLQTQKTSHDRNMELIDKKSTLRSKVEAYLTNSSKMGILDKANSLRRDRNSLKKLSLGSIKEGGSEVEQQSGYLNKLKGELNLYWQKNRVMERSIKSTKAMTNQVKQKIIFYEQELAKSLTDRTELLKTREENILYIRFQTERLKHMRQRLKATAIEMKLKMEDKQNRLKTIENHTNKLNELEGVEQRELDNKQYLLEKYLNYQHLRSQKTSIETNAAIHTLQQNEASSVLKFHQDRISILDRIDYQNEIRQDNHSKYMRELVCHKFFQKVLAAVSSKYHDYYESYEKAEQLIKMYSLDRDNLVQNSYRKSFEIKALLQEQIKAKETQLSTLQHQGQLLQTHYDMHHLDEIEEIQKRLQAMKKQLKIGKQLEKTVKSQEEEEAMRNVSRREEEANRCKQLLVRVKQWVIKQEQKLGLPISKNLPLSTHFEKVVVFLKTELDSKEAGFEMSKFKVSKPKESHKEMKRDKRKSKR